MHIISTYVLRVDIYDAVDVITREENGDRQQQQSEQQVA